MKTIAKVLVFALLLAPIPAIAGHKSKAIDRLGIPSVVADYLHQFGDMRATLIPFCPEMPCKALVAFYDNEDESSFVGTATFEMKGDGSLGRLLIFRFPNGQRWVYDGDDFAPTSGEYHSVIQ